jgi:ATP-dependent Clp endopeptidase proteolytic subunit ClpP
MTKSFTRDSKERGFSMRAEAGQAEILLYDVIDPWFGISAKQFHNELKALGEVSVINLRINSPGGSITEGMAFYNILKRQSAKVVAHVDGIAASMASVIAMAASEIVMATGSYMMIHNPMGVAIGEAEEMRDLAELLDKMKTQVVNIYAARTKQTPADISKLMDDETWFTADEAIEAGFADRTSPELALSAQLAPNLFNKLPQNLKGEAQMSTTKSDEKTPDQIRSELVAQTKDYSDRFGAELAAKWGPLGENKPLLECYAEFVAQLRAGHDAALVAKDAAHATAIAELQTKLAAAEKKATDLDTRLASLSLGEEKPVSGGGVKTHETKNLKGIPARGKAFAAEFKLPESRTK